MQRRYSKAIDQLLINPRNARTHTNKQIHQIANSIREFGFQNPILVDEAAGIIAGHGRLAAAKQLGLKEVPVIEVYGLSAAQKRALALADNKIAENAGWDNELLAIELKELSSLDLPFELELTGFETAEIDLLIENFQRGSADDPADQVPQFEQKAVSRIGDIWVLGSHKLLCGDARDPAAYRRLLADRKVRMCFTDPPYNVRIDGHVGGLGSIQHREFAMGSGEMSGAQFKKFLTQVFRNMANVSQDGAIHFVCMDWRHIAEVLAAGKIYSGLKNLCVWNKTNAGMGSFYRSKHELVFVFKVGKASHINSFELGQSGRYRTNVWDYAGVNTFGPTRMSDLSMHPTVKPVALVADAIKDCSRRADIVLDPFAGSGTTLIAAEKTGRCAYAMEIDPSYTDLVVRRWQMITGGAAVLETKGGATFEEVVKQRSQDAAPPGRR